MLDNNNRAPKILGPKSLVDIGSVMSPDINDDKAVSDEETTGLASKFAPFFAQFFR